MPQLQAQGEGGHEAKLEHHGHTGRDHGARGSGEAEQLDTSSMELFDIFAVLDIPYSATALDARRRFKQLAKQCHPDRNADPDATARFGRLSAAAAMFDNNSAYVELLKGAATIALAELTSNHAAGNAGVNAGVHADVHAGVGLADIRARVAEVLFEIKSRNERLEKEDFDTTGMPTSVPSSSSSSSSSSTGAGAGTAGHAVVHPILSGTLSSTTCSRVEHRFQGLLS